MFRYNKKMKFYQLQDLSLMTRLKKNIENPNYELNIISDALLYAEEKTDYVTVSIDTNKGAREISIPKEEFDDKSINSDIVIPAILVSENIKRRYVERSNEDTEHNKEGVEIDNGIENEEWEAYEK